MNIKAWDHNSEVQWREYNRVNGKWELAFETTFADAHWL